MTATAADPATATVYVVGLAALAGGATTVLGALYRWYARDRLPDRFAVMVGLGAVALVVNAEVALQQYVQGGTDITAVDTAVVNVLTFVAAGLVSLVGRRAGDRLAIDATVLFGAREVDAELSTLVRAVGNVITVTLPDEVEDVDGYDPVPAETTAQLAGRTFLFPRGLTVAELRDRLAARLRDDYGVGHVDVELDADGTVSYLAVGRRIAGLGQTLAPGMTALAVRTDPAFGAGPGDVVQVWESNAEPERVATAELRAAVGDVATVVTDTVDADALDPARRYRLVTLPAETRPDREFARLLRAADETLGVVGVAAESDLVGVPVGALDLTTIAVADADGVDPIPSRSRVLAAGDTVYVVARPDAIRRLEQSV